MEYNALHGGMQRWFEPMAAPDGKLAGLRFVFAPYQVGPYSDGTQTVEVPADVLLPHIAPEFRPLFTTVAPPPAGDSANPR